MTLARYRSAFTTSRTKDDPTDAEYALELLLRHPKNSRRRWQHREERRSQAGGVAPKSDHINNHVCLRDRGRPAPARREPATRPCSPRARFERTRWRAIAPEKCSRYSRPSLGRHKLESALGSQLQRSVRPPNVATVSCEGQGARSATDGTSSAATPCWQSWRRPVDHTMIRPEEYPTRSSDAVEARRTNSFSIG
jgi:hypothetical protein